jgi:hypothetical protein
MTTTPSADEINEVIQEAHGEVNIISQYHIRAGAISRHGASRICRTEMRDIGQSFGCFLTHYFSHALSGRAILSR